MLKTLNTRRGGFTLVEIMIVVAIIALLAAIAVPNFLRARKRTQATRALEDIRMIDSALDQYAIENNKAAQDPVTFEALRAYLKTGSNLETNGAALYGSNFTVDRIPQISATIYGQYSDVAPTDFWTPYYGQP